MASNDPGLYLIVASAGGEAALQRLRAALTAAPVASVLITGHGGDARRAEPYVQMIQSSGVAALIDADASLARTLRADVVHLRAADGAPSGEDAVIAAYAEARALLGARMIVGVDTGGSKHAAMELGEAGADYIAFSGPDGVEMASWWAGIFEVPCVAFDAATPEDAAMLARTGAEFVACTLAGAGTAGDAQQRVQAFAAAIAGHGHDFVAAGQ